MVNIKYLLSRRKKALNIKKNWEPLLQKTYRYSQPNRNLFDKQPIGEPGDDTTTSGENLNWYVYDNTMSQATDILANRLISALVPAGKKWLTFVAGIDIDAEFRAEVKKQLSRNTDMFFQYIWQSNFQLVIHECIMDMIASTGFMVANEGFEEGKHLIFASLPPDRTYADEGPYGTFDAFFRDYRRLPFTHAEVMWNNIRKPDSPVNNQDDAECDLFNLYEIVYKDYKLNRWIQVVIHQETEALLFEQTHSTSPIIGFRSKKLSGEVYGRGSAMDYMPTAATINQAMHDEIVSANFKALPIWMGFGDGIFNPNTAKLIPNTVLSCSPIASGTWPLTPMPSAGDLQWGVVVINDLRDQIGRGMLSSPYGNVEDPSKTATEIIERKAEYVENASTMFSRLQRELFDPLVERIVSIMKKNGDWNAPQVDGKKIAIRYETPLVISQGQKEVLDFLQLDQFLKQIFGAEASSGFYNIEQIAPWMADKLNTNLDLTKTKDEIMEAMSEAEAERIRLMSQVEGSGGVEPQPATLEQQQSGVTL